MDADKLDTSSMWCRTIRKEMAGMLHHTMKHFTDFYQNCVRPSCQRHQLLFMQTKQATAFYDCVFAIILYWVHNTAGE